MFYLKRLSVFVRWHLLCLFIFKALGCHGVRETVVWHIAHICIYVIPAGSSVREYCYPSSYIAKGCKSLKNGCPVLHRNLPSVVQRRGSLLCFVVLSRSLHSSLVRTMHYFQQSKEHKQRMYSFPFWGVSGNVPLMYYRQDAMYAAITYTEKQCVVLTHERNSLGIMRLVSRGCNYITVDGSFNASSPSVVSPHSNTLHCRYHLFRRLVGAHCSPMIWPLATILSPLNFRL